MRDKPFQSVGNSSTLTTVFQCSVSSSKHRLSVLLVGCPAFLFACGTDTQGSPSSDTGATTDGVSSGLTSSATTGGVSVATSTAAPRQTNTGSFPVATNSGASNQTSSTSSDGVVTTSEQSLTNDTSIQQGSTSSVTSGNSGGSDESTSSVPVDTTPRPRVEAAAGTTLVRVDVSVQHQRFEGWGTSLCWWANHVGGWSEQARNAVVKAVVDPVEGMGYNIFRYNIGGGENPSHSHMTKHRDMPGFSSPEGQWNWDADANQRSILLAINEMGTDLIYEAFSNSPPYWMTKSGCASGHASGADNLKEDSYDAFADYLTEVVKYYRDQHDIAFRTLEPLNEPYSDWWKSNGTQEGCHFSVPNQERIIAAVAEKLATKGLTATAVSAADENSMDDALRNFGAYSQTTIDIVQQLNVHSYAGSRRKELRELADQLGKRLWQSESGPLGQNISDDTDAALFMAGRIITDLRELKPEAWLDWQSGDPGRSWASFTLSDQGQTYQPIKRFFMHAGFSRYIRPGATFVAVNNDEMVAAWSADNQYVTIVARNGERQASRAFTFDLTSLPNVGKAAAAYRVSKTEDLVELEALPIDGYSFVVTLPAYSVTTFVVPLQ